MADPAAVANMLCELIAENTAGSDDVTDYTVLIPGEDNSFALISLEEQAVYKVIVVEAQLVPASNQDRDRDERDPARRPDVSEREGIDDSAPQAARGVESGSSRSETSDPASGPESA